MKFFLIKYISRKYFFPTLEVNDKQNQLFCRSESADQSQPDQ